MSAASANRAPVKGSYRALALATGALAINFWAWTLLSPLGTAYAKDLDLSPSALAFLLAIPVIVGSAGRIVLGAITDKYGGKKVFSVICLLEIIPVIALAFLNGYGELAITAVWLGLGGAVFAVGVPFVSAWFPLGKRGFALGIYSMGNAGAAVSGFLTPRLADNLGRPVAFLTVAGLLAAASLAFLVYGKNAPGWKPAKGASARRLAQAASSRLVRDLSGVYVITFGAFVAFGVYLPVLLKVAYGLPATDAAARAAGFILLATAARPVGGWLSDKLAGKLVIQLSLSAVAILATYTALQPNLGLQTTSAYLALAATLGCANGAVFALVGKLAKPDSVGAVTGIVGALGGLGGFLPPLVLGFTYERTHSYSMALLMLAASTLAVLCYVSLRFKDPIYKVPGLKHA